MTMENTAVNVSLFVTSLQLEGTTPLEKYHNRLGATISKLDSLIGSLTPRVVNYEGWRGDTSIVLAIRNTVGIYTIFSDKERKSWTGLTIPPLWGKKGDGRYSLGLNNVWQPWLGDTGITHLGGKVVVSLSDIGIEYLNEIADRVASVGVTE